jgi:putative superfamily III holin-X
MQLGGQLSQLLRAEVALARAELFARARQAVTGGVLAGAAALLGLTGWLAVVAAGIAGVAQALPVWAAAAIIGGFLLLSALGLAARGIRQLRSVPPLTLTAASLRRDAAAVKARAGQR